VFAAGLQKVKLTSEIRTILNNDHPGLAVIDEVEHYFDVPRSFIVFLSQDTNQLNVQTLKKIDDLTLALQLGPNVIGVRSLSNSTYIYSNEDDIYTDYIFNRKFPLEHTNADYKKINEWISNDPTLVDSFISKDSKVSAIVVNTNLDQSAKTSQMQEVHDFIESEVMRFTSLYPEIRVDISGELEFDLVDDHALNHDLGQNMGLSFLFIVILLLFIFRSFLSAFLVSLISVASCLGAIGFAGYAGIAINNINITAPIIIIVVAVLDGIHFLSVYHKHRNLMSKIDAVDSATKLTFKPITLTTVTTATGFIALNVSSSPAISSLGNITAVGIAMGWLFTFGLLPSLVGFTRAKKQEDAQDWIDRLLSIVLKFVLKYPVKIITVFAILFLALLTQIPRIIIDDDPFNSLDEHLPYVQSQEYIRSQMHASQFSLYINSGEERGIHDADLLNRVDELTAWIKSQDKIINAHSYVDHIKRISQIMNGDDNAFYKIPSDDQLVAQYGLLYKFSIPSPDELSRYTDLDEQRIILTVYTDEISRNNLNVLVDEINNKALQLDIGSKVKVTGWTVLFSSETMTWVSELLYGFGVAFLLISLQMFLFFRSFKMGLISLIPNVTPIAITFGLWGIGQQPFDFITLLVLSASFGIVIDDTIHFISKFSHHFHKHLDTVAALEYAFRFSGRAIVMTTIVLAVGLSPMLFSHLVSMQSITKLITPIAFFALITDLLLLPAILLIINKKHDGAIKEGS
jgi:predicted RND superfamily exporter protein